MSFDAQLTALGLVLPAPPKPVATYIPVVRAGDLLFLSGMIPLRDGILIMAGKLGQEISVEQGYEAARICLLNALAVIRQQLGTLDRVQQVVKMVGYVASTAEFVQQPAVINGASDLLVKLFGDAGRHARVAVGAAALPLNAPVEIELIIQMSVS
ncbi:MAG: RidA family protein [Nitrospirota bacterium]|nr:RidA family protein [Nitrospirota bacterium]